MKNNYDLIIVGGGLVGASLGLALMDSDLRIAIIESQPATILSPNDPNVRSIVLSYTSEQIFKTLGLWSELEPYLTPISLIHISDRGHFGVTRIDPQDYGLSNMGHAISVVALADALFKKLESAKNITWIRPAKVTAIDGKRLTVNDEIIEGNLIIAADGSQSTLRNLLNIEAEVIDYQQTAVVCNVTLDRDHRNIAYERFTVNGPIALIPHQAKQMTAVYTTHDDLAQQNIATTESEFLKTLQTEFGYRAGAFIAVGKRSLYSLKATIVTEQHLDKVMMLGNSAHAVHPVSGQGFNLSLRDVAQLAENLLLQFPKDLSDTTFLQNYFAQRKANQEATVQYTDDLVRIFSTDAFPVTPLRSLFLHELNNFSWIKRRIVRGAMGFRGASSRLVRGLKIK